MSRPLTVENSMLIEAPASKVWDALVNPEQTRKYMFGCRAETDWIPGSELLWKALYEGEDTVFVKGKIVAIQAGKYLSYTTIDPQSSIADIPENYLTVTYTLVEKGSQTILTVTQGDYATVAQGEKRFKETLEGGGWNSILTEIKKLVETGS